MDVTVGPSLLCLPAPREDGKLGSHPIRERWIREGEHPKPPRTAASQPASSVLEGRAGPVLAWCVPGGQHRKEGRHTGGREAQHRGGGVISAWPSGGQAMQLPGCHHSGHTTDPHTPRWVVPSVFIESPTSRTWCMFHIKAAMGVSPLSVKNHALPPSTIRKGTVYTRDTVGSPRGQRPYITVGGEGRARERKWARARLTCTYIRGAPTVHMSQPVLGPCSHSDPTSLRG